MDFAKVPSIWFLLSAVVFVLGLAASALLGSHRFTLGFAAGGALVLLNAWASARKIRKAEFPHRGRVTAALLGGFYVRLILLGICLFGLIRYVNADPLGLVTGLSVVPAGLFLMLILIYIANRRPEEV